MCQVVVSLLDLLIILYAGWPRAINAADDTPLRVPLPHNGANYDLTSSEETLPDTRQFSRSRFAAGQRENNIRKS